MTTKDRFNYLTFSDWNAMYHFITSEGDLYNPFLNKYAFTYNNDGAICVYDVTPAEAVELVEQSVENHELWSASLGTGGQILDNDSLDRNDEQYLAVSYEFCKENYNKVGWMRTDDFFQDSYTRKFIKYQATDAQKKYLGQAIKIHDYCEMSILFDYTDDVHYDLLTSALAEIAETDTLILYSQFFQTGEKIKKFQKCKTKNVFITTICMKTKILGNKEPRQIQGGKLYEEQISKSNARNTSCNKCSYCTAGNDRTRRRGHSG